jgi:hypothetical protein
VSLDVVYILVFCNILIPNRLFPNQLLYFIMNTKLHFQHFFQLRTIWNWLPQRFTVYKPCLVFTTSEHGSSLNTLYNKIDHLEYSIIVIKTIENEVFGAFCSGNIKIKLKHFLLDLE